MSSVCVTIYVSLELRDFPCHETDPLDHLPVCTAKNRCNSDNSVQTMRRPRASGTLRIETVFRAFVGANSAAEVTIQCLDETFLLGNSRKQEPSR